MSKTLVTYFSATGTTKNVALKLAEALGADVFEIKPKVPYTSADLNWQDKNARSTVEMKDKSSRPEIAETKDLSGYDTVYVGFPVWWYTAPTIINTFLESTDTSGKKIVLFATSGGSGISSIPADLKKSAPNAEIIAGKVLNGNPSVDEIKKLVD